MCQLVDDLANRRLRDVEHLVYLCRRHDQGWRKTEYVSMGHRTRNQASVSCRLGDSCTDLQGRIEPLLGDRVLHEFDRGQHADAANFSDDWQVFKQLTHTLL